MVLVGVTLVSGHTKALWEHCDQHLPHREGVLRLEDGNAVGRKTVVVPSDCGMKWRVETK